MGLIKLLIPADSSTHIPSILTKEGLSVLLPRDAPKVSQCWHRIFAQDSWLSQLAAPAMLRPFLVGMKLTFLGFGGYSTAEIAEISIYNILSLVSETNQSLRAPQLLKSECNLTAVTNVTKAQDKVNWAYFPLGNPCVGCSLARVRSLVMGRKLAWENQNMNRATHAVLSGTKWTPSKLVFFHSVFMTVVSTLFSTPICSCFYIHILYLLKSEVTSAFLPV